MNMSKKCFFLIVLFILCFPFINVSAKTVTAKCKCTNENGTLKCTENNCSPDVIEKTLQNSCGKTGTLGTVEYTCDYYSGNSPIAACTNRNNVLGSVATHLTVRASATCTAGQTARVGDDFCEDAQDTIRFFGYLLLFGKILVPFLIITMGTFDYFKVVTSGKEEDVKKQSITLLKRVISGVVIFFIPSILNATFTLINGWSAYTDEYKVCATCLLDPTECD